MPRPHREAREAERPSGRAGEGNAGRGTEIEMMGDIGGEMGRWGDTDRGEEREEGNGQRLADLIEVEQPTCAQAYSANPRDKIQACK